MTLAPAGASPPARTASMRRPRTITSWSRRAWKVRPSIRRPARIATTASAAETRSGVPAADQARTAATPVAAAHDRILVTSHARRRRARHRPHVARVAEAQDGDEDETQQREPDPETHVLAEGLRHVDGDDDPGHEAHARDQ